MDGGMISLVRGVLKRAPLAMTSGEADPGKCGSLIAMAGGDEGRN